jgi:hypothetical protein
MGRYSLLTTLKIGALVFRLQIIMFFFATLSGMNHVLVENSEPLGMCSKFSQDTMTLNPVLWYAVVAFTLWCKATRKFKEDFSSTSPPSGDMQ